MRKEQLKKGHHPSKQHTESNDSTLYMGPSQSGGSGGGSG